MPTDLGVPNLIYKSWRHDYARFHQHPSSHQEEWSISQALSTLPRPIQDHPSGTQDLELQVRTIAQELTSPRSILTFTPIYYVLTSPMILSISPEENQLDLVQRFRMTPKVRSTLSRNFLITDHPEILVNTLYVGKDMTNHLINGFIRRIFIGD